MIRPLIAGLVVAACGLYPAHAGAEETPGGSIAGIVVHAKSGARLAGALVVLQCTCLASAMETTTNENGLYAFRALPPGTYTIQVLSGEADVSKVTTLPAAAKFRANFRIDPQADFRRAIRVQSSGVSLAGATGASMDYTSTPPPSRPAEPRLSAKEKLVAHRRLAVEARDDLAKGAESSADIPAPEPSAALPGVEPEQATKPLPDDYARQVVYSGAMDLGVFDVGTTRERVEKLVVDAGGWVQVLRGHGMLLRIPASEFRVVAEKIGALGRIERQEFEALDVTEDYYDLHTRIEVLRRTHAQLLDLLDKARTVTQALEVRRELDKVTLELEAALGRQRVLQSQVRFSVLSLALTERRPQTDVPSTNDPFPWVDEIGVEGTAWR
jgi:hypothetical protein